MKRSAFLASLLGVLGIGQAQQWREDEPERTLNCMGWDKEGNITRAACGHSGTHKPALNNQCPVCGTMAKPYRGKRAYSEPWCEGGPQQFPPTKEMLAQCEDLPRQRITRCLRCSAAFWQNSEDKK